MKLLNYRHPLGPRPGIALTAEVGLDLLAADPSLPVGWIELFPLLGRVRDLAAPWNGKPPREDQAHDAESPLFPIRERLLLPPVQRPGQIIAVGRNYREHATEQHKEPPKSPLLFSKSPSCLQGCGGPITLDADLTQVDAEAELAVVIGRQGRKIRREDAADHIAGYTCFNDISDREAQFADKQWFRGKSIDTGGPCGPWLVTPDELPPLAAGLAISGRLNGKTMQQSDTAQMIFPVDELISYASRHMTLMPGDIIATGTPSGVGVFRSPPVFLKPGDRVEVEIEGIGVLTNPVIGI